MFAKLRCRLTYANVIATLALFVALGGSSYAAIKITGKNVPKDALTGADIKKLTGRDVTNNSLTGADVKNLGSGDVANGKLLAEDFKAGQLPAGPQGLKGDTGTPGKNGPTNVVVRQGGNASGGGNTSFNTTTGTFDTAGGAAGVSAGCDPGERATGGGYSAPSGSRGFLVTRNVPMPLTGTPTGWEIEVVSTTTSASPSVTVYVVCAMP